MKFEIAIISNNNHKPYPPYLTPSQKFHFGPDVGKLNPGYYSSEIDGQSFQDVNSQYSDYSPDKLSFISARTLDSGEDLPWDGHITYDNGEVRRILMY